MSNQFFRESDLAYLSYIRVPRELFFLNISSDVKIMYSLLLDRMQLSIQNGWIDYDKKCYLIYQVEDIMKDLKISSKTAVKIMKELEKLDFLERIKQGQGKPSLIYLKKVDFKKFAKNIKLRKLREEG